MGEGRNQEEDAKDDSSRDRGDVVPKVIAIVRFELGHLEKRVINRCKVAECSLS